MRVNRWGGLVWRAGDQAAIERHLLTSFLPTIYTNPSRPPSTSPAAVPLAEYRAERAGRWLTFVAELLTANNTTDLAWWRLIDAAPRLARLALSTMAFTAFYAPTSAIIIIAAARVSHGISTGLTVGPVAGACGGLAAGLGYGLAGEFVDAPTPSLSRVRLRPRAPNPVALAAGALGFGITGAAIGGWTTGTSSSAAYHLKNCCTARYWLFAYPSDAESSTDLLPARRGWHRLVIGLLTEPPRETLCRIRVDPNRIVALVL